MRAVISKVGAIVVGVAVFMIWLRLVGPSVHVVESIIGLALGLAGGFWFWWEFRPKSKRAADT